jgi:predicted CoA-binding protein
VTDHIRTIWEKAATIAVAGLSSNDTKAAHAVPAFLQAVAIGAKVLWLQQGVRSAEARRIAEDDGLQYVKARCMGKLTAFYGITKVRQVSST